MNTSYKLSFPQHQAAQAANQMYLGINAQMAEAKQADEVNGADQSTGQIGKVSNDNPASKVELNYDPLNGQADSFTFEAKDNIGIPEQNVLLFPKGLKNEYSRSETGVETYKQSMPTQEGGIAQQELSLDSANNTVSLTDAAQNTTILTLEQSAASNQAAHMIGGILQEVQGLMQIDENPQVDQAVSQPGMVKIANPQSTTFLQYDAAGGTVQNFSFVAHEDLKDQQGNVVVAKGTKSSLSVENGVETYTRELPTPNGVGRQQTVVDPSQQTLEYGEWLVS